MSTGHSDVLMAVPAAGNASALRRAVAAVTPAAGRILGWLWSHKRFLALALFFLFLLLPVYWMLNCSLRPTNAITTDQRWFPADLTWANYVHIFGNREWAMGLVSTLLYVLANVALVMLAAVPAAYAFSRWDFRGSKHLFFWLLTNRMAPGAVFATPMLILYSNLHLFDTIWAVAIAHCLFNLPLAIWILEGFMSGIPREVDETAFIDGMGFTRFFLRVFLPLIKPGLGVAAFFCFLFSWTELLLAKTLTNTSVKPIAVKMSEYVNNAAGIDWGVLCAAGVVTMVPGVIMVYFIRNYIAKGFAMGRV